ncbi:sensor domain-containing diguanylate cyclase [bacterium]|nr:sensor domain-containing diguanylate cyclase [bacterium]MCB2179281.1 sensor domain-containing diguanylate cyclase [bacterium]
MEEDFQEQPDKFANLPDSFYKTLLQSMHDGVYMVDRERRIMFWNQSAEELTGYTSDEVMGHFCGDGLLQHVDMDGKLLCGDGCPLQTTIEDGQPRSMDVFLKHKDGYRLPVRVSAGSVFDNQGQVVGAVETFVDITPHLRDRMKIKELSEKANRDAVTKLYNRAALDMFLQDALIHWEKYNEPFGVIFIDVDDLKRINDKLGHSMGDIAIRTVANTLSACFRENDVVARWGGDEFLILLRDVNASILEKLVKKAENVICITQLPGYSDWGPLSVSAGGALIQPGDTPETLVGRADAQMYSRKHNKK